MWKSKKFIIIGVIMAVVVLVGLTAGVALAQGGTRQFGQGNQIMARVAQILGVDQQKLADAFKQATDEFKAQNPRPERQKFSVDQIIDKLLQENKITKEQADQWKAWEAKKPADPRSNPQQFQDWLKSRPDIPFPKPNFNSGNMPFRGFGQGQPPAPGVTPK